MSSQDSEAEITEQDEAPARPRASYQNSVSCKTSLQLLNQPSLISTSSAGGGVPNAALVLKD